MPADVRRVQLRVSAPPWLAFRQTCAASNIESRRCFVFAELFRRYYAFLW
jgi:hypothetical protein